MANRRLNQFQYTYQIDPVHCWAKITFGSSGAPTLATNPLFSAVVRNSAGDYTFTLRDQFYGGLMSAQHAFVKATAPSSPAMWVKADNSSTSTKTLEVVFNSAGTATDPASGEIVLLHFVFKNSSV